MSRKKSSRNLLAKLARLLKKVGPDDPRVDAFIEKNKANQEFAKLAPRRALKRPLMPKDKGC